MFEWDEIWNIWKDPIMLNSYDLTALKIFIKRNSRQLIWCVNISSCIIILLILKIYFLFPSSSENNLIHLLITNEGVIGFIFSIFIWVCQDNQVIITSFWSWRVERTAHTHLCCPLNSSASEARNNILVILTLWLQKEVILQCFP